MNNIVIKGSLNDFMEFSVKNVQKSFMKKEVLKKISIDLTPGIYALVGTNGAGKTTLMQILTGLIPADKGEILINGVKVNPQDPTFSKRIGYLPQETPIYKNFSAHKFLLYLATIKGIEKEKRSQKVEEVLRMVNLTESANSKLKSLSGGMKRRIGIAQLLLDDTEILIIDEPTAGLDPKERMRFHNLLSTISNEKIVILSTHIMSDISSIAKEILLMEDGQIIKTGTPQALLSELERMVWSVEATYQELVDIQLNFQTSSVKQLEGGLHRTRILSKSKPHERAELDTPELEDLYLFYLDGEKI